MEFFSNDQLEFIKSLKSNPSIDSIRDQLSRYNFNNPMLFNLCWDYFSNFILSDGELLQMIETYRTGDIPRKGLLDPDLVEIDMLMRAYKSQQYRRFILHITRTYTNNEVFPRLNGTGIECSVCWRPIYSLEDYTNHVDPKTDPNMEYVAFSNNFTRTHVCVNCLTNIVSLSEILKGFGDGI